MSVGETSKLLDGKDLRPSLLVRYVHFLAAIAVYVIIDRSLHLIHSAVAPGLIGMFGIFAMLCVMTAAGQESIADWIIEMLSPATEFIARFLPVFYIPNLVLLPWVVYSTAIGAAVCLKLGIIILCGIPFSLFLTAALVSGVRSFTKVSTLDVEALPNVSPCSRPHAMVFGMLAIFSIFMVALLSEGQARRIAVAVFLLTATASGMLVEMAPQTLQKLTLHPALACMGMGILGCYVVSIVTRGSFMSAQQMYITHASAFAEKGGGDWLLLGLGPVLLSFGIHMYKERLHLFRHWLELLIASAGASLCSLVVTTSAGRLIGLPPSISLAIAPRSFTVALSIPISKCLGVPEDLLAVTGATCVCTGLLGGAVLLQLLKVGGIKDPVTRGFSCGSAAMGMGTATLAKVEASSLPFSALAYALVGIAGSLWVEVVPGIVPMLQAIAGAEASI